MISSTMAARPVMIRGAVDFNAVEELKMLTQTEEERERYEARRKAQLDYNTGLRAARIEGHIEGRTEGRTEGEILAIHLCERLLQRPETPTEQLACLPLEGLTRLRSDLQEQVLKQR